MATRLLNRRVLYTLEQVFRHGGRLVLSSVLMAVISQ
jgi:hypothetical protein